jgi:BMFP domain-containing protein YqiC
MSDVAAIKEPTHITVLRGWVKEDHEVAVMALVEDGSFREWTVKLLAERDSQSAELAALRADLHQTRSDRQREHDLRCRLAGEAEALRARVAALEAALGWYGKTLGRGSSMARRVIFQDAGERARAALESQRDETYFSLVAERDALRAELARERAINTTGCEMSEACCQCQTLRARVAELEAAVKAHNDGCVAACESRQEAQYCDPYIQRGRQCVDCPRDNMIDLPVQSAGTALRQEEGR